MEDAANAHKASSAEPGPGDLEAMKRIVLALCAERGRGKSICPSEAARIAGGDPNDPSRWRPLMKTARAAAAELQDEGRIQVLRKGKPVDIRTVKGVIRLALPED